MGGGSYCAVSNCTNSNSKSNKNNLNLSFHRFPRDNRRKDWIHRCKRSDKFNPDNCYICSTHFEDNDYEIDMRAKIMGLPERRILKNIAIPHLNIPGFGVKRSNPNQDEIKMEQSRSYRMKKRLEGQNRKDVLSSALTSTEIANSNATPDPSNENLNSDANIDLPKDNPSTNYYELYMSERSKNEELQREMEQLKEDQKKVAGIAQNCIDSLVLLL